MTQQVTAPLSRRRRLAPVFALFVLAPWTAECSWGGFALQDYPAVVIFLAPLYGGAAVLIRETARRTGGGWPAIVLLAAAFGVIQAGLVDQSMFNPDFLDDTEFGADTEFGQAMSADDTWVPGLGVSAQQAFSYLGNHIMLSICAPIAIVESFLGPERRSRPWLRRPGLVAVAVLYVLGSLLIFSDSEDGRKGFVLGTGQLVLAVLAVLALVGAALLPRWRRRPRVDRPAPHPIWAALVVLGASVTADLVPGWAGLVLQALAALVAAVVIVRWSRRTGWGQRHVLASWGAGVALAAAFAYVVPNYAPASPAAAVIGDVAISVITVAVLGGAFWRLAHQRL